VWQWNHNPVDQLWSVDQRPGFLRLTTGSLATGLMDAKNTLTQRTFGPQSSATIAMDVTGMKDGDYSGISLLQKKFGWIGIKMVDGAKFITSEGVATASTTTEIPFSQRTIYLRADCNFQDRKDQAKFFYSLDGKSWTAIDGTLKMEYTIPHFMGYRFGLFNYSTKSAGGYADFDYFHISSSATN